MSYYRPPDDLPDAAPAPTGVPGPPVVPIATVVAGAEAQAARGKRKQRIIAACVVVDVIIVAIVLAVVLG